MNQQDEKHKKIVDDAQAAELDTRVQSLLTHEDGSTLHLAQHSTMPAADDEELASGQPIIVQRYRNLSKKSKRSVRQHVALSVIVLIANVILALHDNVPAIFIALSAAALTISVGLAMSVFEKLTALNPVENDITNSVLSFRAEIDRMRGETEAGFEIMRMTLSEMHAYDRYNSARNIYGFNMVVGPVVMLEDRQGEYYAKKPNDLIVEILAEAMRGDIICYHTSFISNHERFIEAARSAIARGARIRLMMMMPSKDSPLINERWTDLCISETTTKELFYHQVRNSALQIQNFCKKISSAAKSPDSSPSAFEIIFFKNALNFPLIIRTDSQGKADVAYTGFFAHRSAEDMPYTKWMGGDFGIVSAFSELFESKWTACSAFTEIED